ncbi:TonB-dependent siderophore receptor [Lewinella sp. JB7]|uniref:TonB-dependent receptor plug domain-containing protein n=1 Tax=Lewinella sp. JB7 TaxID=2962887 RepID=UPI0020CA1262|nr:TonB-dependent receptor [Lewinella sp. JB7]MCP9236644.1 TonB-dependent receptor [Lewinella sp. JB7]
MHQCTAFLFFCIFLSGQLSAQSAPTLSTTGDAVIVTGARYARPAVESPDRVTVIDSATIARSADLSQLLNEQAGIVINGAYSNPGKDKSVFLRNGGNQYTLILVDGQPLIDPSSLGGAVDLRLLSLRGIQRIEILRGARSLLYGSDAVAGVINLITEPAHTAPAGDGSSPVRWHLRAAAQRYNTYEGSVAASGRTEKLEYRLGYDYYTTRGLSEAAEPASGQHDFDRDGAQRHTYSAGLTYRPTEHWTIRPALRHATFAGDYDAGPFTDAENTYTNELWLPSLAADYVKGKTSAGVRYTYAATDRIFDDAAFGRSPFRGRAHQGDAYAILRPRPSLHLTAGAQLRHEKLESSFPDVPNLTAVNLAPYLQFNWIPAERWLVEAGYRYNHHGDFGGQSNYSVAVGARASERLGFRASVASAFQSPTPDQLGGPFGANPELQPQVSTSVEVGARLDDPTGKFRIDLAVFQRNIEQLIVYDFQEGYLNRDALRDRGIELEAAVRIGQRFHLSGNLTYVSGRLREQTAPDQVTETTDFPRRPRLTSFAGVTYRAESPFLLRLTGSYTGERQDLIFDENFAPLRPTLEPYALVNVYTEYRFGGARGLTVFGEVQNLTDSDFVEVSGFSTVGIVPRLGVAYDL